MREYHETADIFFLYSDSAILKNEERDRETDQQTDRQTQRKIPLEIGFFTCNWCLRVNRKY